MLVASEARSAEWTLTNTLLGCNAGFIGCTLYGPPNGYAVPVDGGYTLVGDDLPHYVARATYTTIAEASGDLTFAWNYYSHEPFGFGSFQDPAGYLVDGVFTQLTVDSVVPLCPGDDLLCTHREQSGTATFSVAAGQSFGFYVMDRDGGFGAGEITFRAVVPEASTWLLLIFGYGALGAALRARRTLREREA